MFRPDIVNIESIRRIEHSYFGLDLSNFRLWNYSADYISGIFSEIPETIEHLDVSGNQLFRYRPIENILQILRAIPKSITCLNLTMSCLYSREISEVALIIGALHKNIKVIINASCESKLLATNKWYKNFMSDIFVRHADLNKANIYRFTKEFCGIFVEGKALDPLVDRLGKYLEPVDFLSLLLVIKNNNVPHVFISTQQPPALLWSDNSNSTIIQKPEQAERHYSTPKPRCCVLM